MVTFLTTIKDDNGVCERVAGSTRVRMNLLRCTLASLPRHKRRSEVPRAPFRSATEVEEMKHRRHM